ncbi:MAG: DUF2817 domain-containing protein [Actinomycetota bacterium]
MSSPDPLPQTYAASRASFRATAAAVGAPLTAHPIEAPGPEGEELTIDVATLGDDAPRRALVVLSGVHGVEGFATAAAQTAFLAGLGARPAGPGLRIILVHAVNPWGMAWGRRQNEANVDLNRGWDRGWIDPPRNEPYDELHPLLCPDGPTVPDPRAMFEALAPITEAHGLAWVERAITAGQYHHPDGMHYAGHRTEPSCEILADVLGPMLAPLGKVLVLDLHTGAGPYGEMTYLSGEPVDSPANEAVGAIFGHATPSAAWTPGRIGPGVAALAAGPERWSVTVEVGTVSDTKQLAAAHREQWVHRFGDDRPAHADIRRAYRACFTPEDPDWKAAARRGLADALDRALAAVAD